MQSRRTREPSQTDELMLVFLVLEVKYDPVPHEASSAPRGRKMNVGVRARHGSDLLLEEADGPSPGAETDPESGAQ